MKKVAFVRSGPSVFFFTSSSSGTSCFFLYGLVWRWRSRSSLCREEHRRSSRKTCSRSAQSSTRSLHLSPVSFRAAFVHRIQPRLPARSERSNAVSCYVADAAQARCRAQKKYPLRLRGAEGPRPLGREARDGRVHLLCKIS